MKKFSVLIALVLLAVAGTGYAVTCAYDNVPAATLLVPYFKVSLNGATGAPIPSGGTDTLVSIVNVSTPGVIAHVTVWNKYSKAVIDFNLPLTGKDVVSFSMKDIMNGRLSPNFPQCDLNLPPADLAKCQATYPIDPCGLKNPGLPSATYVPDVGFAQTQFIRFSHPDAAASGIDVLTSISQYNTTTADAIGAGFRGTVWNSLDESGDITSFTSPGSPGGNILDKDNPACGWTATNPLTGPALSGYLTIDVVNYCTNFFPDQADFYNKDAIATAGWTEPAYPDFPCTAANPCPVTYTPNVLIGDVFYVDTATQGGNVSGDPAVAVEFDARLPYTFSVSITNPTTRTFFGKFVAATAVTPCNAEATTGCLSFINSYAPAFQFPGDGREPLGDHYGFRYLADQANGLQSWITVWRSDWYQGTAVNLCAWADPTTGHNKGASGTGLYDTLHQVVILTYDNDENLFGGVGIPPGPSGQLPGSQSPNYVFLESQRIDLLAASVANQGWNPALFKGGWVDMTFRGPGYDGLLKGTGLYNMGWVGVQHTAPGAFISVGLAASNLNNDFQCQPNRIDLGTEVDYTNFPTFNFAVGAKSPIS
ncbi:MAG: hypothetical protein ACHQM4_03010, partial [Thermoanaerobaculia bacterium]